MESWYQSAFKELSKRKIKYLIVGGMAVILHGYDRRTGDLDLMVAMDEPNLQNLIEAIRSLGWKPRIPVKLEDFVRSDLRESWMKEKGMKVFSVFNPKKNAETMDILIESGVNFEKAYDRRERMTVYGIPIHVAAIEDVIQLKKAAGRQRDLEDIRALKQIQELNRESGKKQ